MQRRNVVIDRVFLVYNKLCVPSERETKKIHQKPAAEFPPLQISSDYKLSDESVVYNYNGRIQEVDIITPPVRRYHLIVMFTALEQTTKRSDIRILHSPHLRLLGITSIRVVSSMRLRL